MLKPPDESAFPAIPATWYLFGSSREVGKRPVAKNMLGRRLVAFRPRNGQIAVLDSTCSHLAADLSLGRVVGGCLQCPYHQWRYDGDGRCVEIPAQAEIPAFARQRSYPTVERHGQIFFFAGSRPLLPLPFFDGCRPEDFHSGRPFHFSADLAWHMLVANGFDGQHFQAVHDRRLLAPPVVTCPTPLSRRVIYHAEVVGESIFDKILRPTVGRTVDISISSHSGPLVLVTGTFQRTTSYVMVSVRPLATFALDVAVTVFAPRSRNPLVRGLGEWLGLEVRRLFTRGFMHDDTARLRGIRYNPQTLIDSDWQLRDFFCWVATLPAESHESAAATRTFGAPVEPRPLAREPIGETVQP